MRAIRSATIGPDSRPVSIPDDADDPSVVKASGRVELPVHIRWSGPRIVYDLSIPAERARVYEQVLREGTLDDVRFYIDISQLRQEWDALVLPRYVRRAWAEWFRRKLEIELPC